MTLTATATMTVFTTTGADLLRALSATKVAAAHRPAAPCLAGLLIETTDGQVRLTQYDYTSMVRVDLDTTEAADNARLLIHHGKLLTTLTALRSTTTPKAADRAPVSLIVDERGRPSLAFAGYTMPLEDMPVEDYPTLPAIPEVVARVATADYIHALGRVASSAGTDETLPMLTGVNFSISETGAALLEATDRYRAAQAPISTIGLSVPGTYNMSAKSLVGLAKHIAPAGELEVLCAPETGTYTYGGISADGITFVTMLLSDEFPTSLTSIIAAAPPVGSITVDTKALLKAVKAAAKLTSSATGHSASTAPVNVWAHTDGVEVAPRTNLEGARATAPVHTGQVTGEPHPHRLVNSAYLAEGLCAVGTDRVSLHYSAKQELLLTAADEHPGDPNAFRYLLMSMRTGS